MGRCKHCGSEVGEGELFCANCGSRLEGETAPERADTAAEVAATVANVTAAETHSEPREPVDAAKGAELKSDAATAAENAVSHEEKGETEQTAAAEREVQAAPLQERAGKKKRGGLFAIIGAAGGYAGGVSDPSQVVARAAVGVHCLRVQQRTYGVQGVAEFVVGHAVDCCCTGIGPVKPENHAHGG